MDLNYEIQKLRADMSKVLELLQEKQSAQSEIKMYDLVDLQRILHVSKRTIATWKQQGKLCYSQVGSKTWVSEEQLKMFLAKYDSELPKNRQTKKVGGINNAD